MASLRDVLLQGFPLSAMAASNSGISLTNGTDVFGIIDWVNNHEQGYFNPKQELRLENPEDPHSRWMLFAKEPIEEDEILATIPWEYIIAPYDYGMDISGDLNCETVNRLHEEINQKEQSNLGPFMKYLHELGEGQIPSTWSEEGKDVIVELLGGLEQEVPPGDIVSILDDDWLRNCNGDKEKANTASIVMQQGVYKAFMVPTSDWYTHRNGKYYNIKTDLTDKESFEVRARRPIEAGEPLHNSLDLCDQCNEEAVESGYGTPEIFRDYGFVERIPQRWSFQPNSIVFETEDDGVTLYAPEQLTFELHESDDGAIRVEWADHILFDDRGRNYIRRLFRKELRRLYRFQNIHYDFEAEEGNSLIPSREWKNIREYYRALRAALQYAIHSLVNEEDGTGLECSDDWSSNEGSCESAHIDIYGVHYDDLKNEEDDLNYIFPTCPTTQLVEFQTYSEVEELYTNYQKLWFLAREEDRDVCMNLENTLQICSNYRPHYHEFFVHFPSRFIEKIERVIFIGGGDAMLLHEVLKYPTLKKVVGLELDQQVTRKSFQYFKSQPHWDDDRVEWWYGDATKSLPLLPQDYWGSFDLVLVDLSETVMSFSVTQTMDIFSALSLLLKPDGIMVKNEPYIEQFGDFFDYSIHIFYGTPKICTQVLVMGSNKVDFLHHPTKDHNVDRLLLEPLDEDWKLRYKYMHDYRKSDARVQGKCIEDDIVRTEHGRKAGVVEILEADQVTFPFAEADLENTLHGVLRKHGLNPLVPPSVYSKAVFTVVMKEGYLVARPEPELRYIAFDINLWGAFSKMDSLRNDILYSVGSKSSSFYRVVVGGMHGANTWEEDQNDIGIQVSQKRDCSKKNIAYTEGNVEDLAQDAMVSALKHTNKFMSTDTSLIAVICGFQEESECLSADVLSEQAGIQVERFWACPALANRTIDDGLDFEDLYSCERKMLGQLVNLNEITRRDIDVVVVDLAAPFVMGQVFNSIWTPVAHREAFLADDNIFISFSRNPEEERWQRNMLERYRKATHFFPVSRAEISMSMGQHKFEFNILTVENRFFFEDLKNFEVDLQASLPNFEIEAKTITGGMHYYDSDYDIQEFKPEAYDSRPALLQASEQRPLGRQSIFQFEENIQEVETNTQITLETLNECLRQALVEVIVDTPSIHRWDSYSDVGDGAVVVTSFRNGGAVMVWDGLHHVDINLYSRNQDKKQADQFVDTFAKKANLSKTLRDDQPRGPGRVVQFSEEMQSTR